MVKLFSRFGETKERKLLEEILQRKIERGKREIDYGRKIPSNLEKLDQELELVNFDGCPAGVCRPDPYEIIIPIGSSEH